MFSKGDQKLKKDKEHRKIYKVRSSPLCSRGHSSVLDACRINRCMCNWSLVLTYLHTYINVGFGWVQIGNHFSYYKMDKVPDAMRIDDVILHDFKREQLIDRRQVRASEDDRRYVIYIYIYTTCILQAEGFV